MARYCQDVIDAQIAAGHDVGLLYPGHFDSGSVRIGHKLCGALRLYQVVNPLPVALSFGVAGPQDYMTPLKDVGPYRDMLVAFRPDVIHVHEIMGIHKEFFELAKSFGVPLVYTTHDYYPICMRCTFVKGDGSMCQDGPTGARCARCNAHSGMTLRRSRAVQSPVFSLYKRSRAINGCVKCLLRMKSMRAQTSEVSADAAQVECDEGGYEQLIAYNRAILNTMDAIFANSELAASIYARVIDPTIISYVPITHAGLSWTGSTHARHADGVVNFAYLGGPKEYKGYGCLLEAFVMFYNDNGRCRLHLFGDGYPKVAVPHVEIHGTLSSDEVCRALSHMDAVVVPSICPETFGFVVLEALAAGTHVICSDSVGARDLVSSDCVFAAGDASDLAEKMHDFSLRASGVGCAVLRRDYPLDIAANVQDLVKRYEEVKSRVRN